MFLFIVCWGPLSLRWFVGLDEITASQRVAYGVRKQTRVTEKLMGGLMSGQPQRSAWRPTPDSKPVPWSRVLTGVLH